MPPRFARIRHQKLRCCLRSANYLKPSSFARCGTKKHRRHQVGVFIIYCQLFWICNPRANIGSSRAGLTLTYSCNGML